MGKISYLMNVDFVFDILCPNQTVNIYIIRADFKAPIFLIFLKVIKYLTVLFSYNTLVKDS